MFWNARRKMEAASLRVVENLDRMSEVAMKELALLCHE